MSKVKSHATTSKKGTNSLEQQADINHKMNFINLKNQLKLTALRQKFTNSKTSQSSTMQMMEPVENTQKLRTLNRMVSIFSAAVITGLSVGLLYMGRPSVTAETLHDKLEDSITAALAYQGNEINLINGEVGYHLPRQFQYKWSLGANDIIKYKNNEVIMHYNNQSNQENVSYELLRDENKAAGEEWFYQEFSVDGQSGFVQLVQLPEKYLLTTYVDGSKLSAIIDYEEAPYLTYNMLLVGRTVQVFNQESTASQVAHQLTIDIETEAIKDEETMTSLSNEVVKNAIDHIVEDEEEQNQQVEAIEEILSVNEESSETTKHKDELEELIIENEQVIQFDFSSEARDSLSMNEE